MEVFGTSIIFYILAIVAFFATGFLWFGVLFQKKWIEAEGFTEEQLQANAGRMPFGFIPPIVVVTVMAILFNKLGVAGVDKGLMKALLLCVGFSLTAMLYYVVYHPRKWLCFAIDAGHVLVAYSLAGILLALGR